MEGEFGVPTAPIVTSRFAEYVLRDGHSHGMNLRWSFPPYPVAWIPQETMRQYIYGDDPVTGVKLMTEVVDALTKPLTEAEKNPEISERPKRPRLVEPDTEENLQRLFLRNGWTDGLPIVLPTEGRVREMLTGTGHAPQEVVGMMSVTTHEEMKEYTVEKVAVNAVMAGARPEHLPVILAIASTQHPAMPSSTGSYGSMVVVNGLDYGKARGAAHLVSGLACGATGAALAASVGAWVPNMSAGRGWIALVAVYLGGKRLGGTVAAVALFSVMLSAAASAQAVVELPAELLLSIPYFIAALVVIVGARRTARRRGT